MFETRDSHCSKRWFWRDRSRPMPGSLPLLFVSAGTGDGARDVASDEFKKSPKSRVKTFRGLTPARTNPSGEFWPGIRIGRTTPDRVGVSQGPRGSGPSTSARSSIEVICAPFTASAKIVGISASVIATGATEEPASIPALPASVAEDRSSSKRYSAAKGMLCSFAPAFRRKPCMPPLHRERCWSRRPDHARCACGVHR